ncbi:MAG: hypothetical protein LM588_00710 [Fervidicoccaceae archaeon]|nr:hypothetical protein [Fervidicoccaceae archaeon]
MKYSIGEVYKSLDDDDKRILLAVELGLSSYLYVPVRVIAKKTRIPAKKLNERLDNLVAKRLVSRRLGAEVGYTLTTFGLDVLALDSLVNRGLIQAVGDRVNVGKESDIYEAISPSGSRLALKFYRIGRTSFRQTARLRPYITEREIHTWLDESKLSAQREFKALVELSRLTEYVPKPVGYSRHAVLIEYVEGQELYRTKTLNDPKAFLDGILQVIDVAYNKVGIVHGDLSEYNVIVGYPDEKPVIIDWPQYVYKDHPIALRLLERDVKYIVRYFEKTFKVKIDVDEVIKRITAEESVSTS